MYIIMGADVYFGNLIAKLENIEKKASKEITEKALKAGGKVMLESLKKEVKKSVYDTGELYDSLDIGPIKSGLHGKLILVGSQSDDREIIERNYYNEYGTSSINGTHHNMRAYINGYDAAKEAMIESIKQDLKE